MCKDANHSKPFMTRGDVTLNNVHNAGAFIAIRFILLLIVLLCIYDDDYLIKNEETLVKMYEKQKKFPPIRGREAWAMGNRKPCECGPL